MYGCGPGHLGWIKCTRALGVDYGGLASHLCCLQLRYEIRKELFNFNLFHLVLGYEERTSL